MNLVSCILVGLLMSDGAKSGLPQKAGGRAAILHRVGSITVVIQQVSVTFFIRRVKWREQIVYYNTLTEVAVKANDFLYMLKCMFLSHKFQLQKVQNTTHSRPSDLKW